MRILFFPMDLPHPSDEPNLTISPPPSINPNNIPRQVSVHDISCSTTSLGFSKTAKEPERRNSVLPDIRPPQTHPSKTAKEPERRIRCFRIQDHSKLIVRRPLKSQNGEFDACGRKTIFTRTLRAKLNQQFYWNRFRNVQRLSSDTKAV